MYRRREAHFDNVIQSTINLSVALDGTYWTNLLYQSINSRGYGRVPGFQDDEYLLKQKSIFKKAPFFVVFLVVGEFCILNLFVGVIINAFNKERERLGRNFLLTQH